MSINEEIHFPSPTSGTQPMMPPPPGSTQPPAQPGADPFVQVDPYAQPADPFAQAVPQAQPAAPDPFAQAAPPAQPTAHDPYAQPGQFAQPGQPAAPDQFAQPAVHDPYAHPAAPNPYAQPATPDQFAQPAAHDQFAQPIQGGLPHVGAVDSNATLFESEDKPKKRFGRSKKETGGTEVDTGLPFADEKGSGGSDHTRIVKIVAAVIGGLFLIGVIGSVALGVFGGDDDSTDVAAPDTELATPVDAGDTGDTDAQAEPTDTEAAAEPADTGTVEPAVDNTPFNPTPGEPYTNATGSYSITPNVNWTPGEVPADAPEGSNAWDIADASGNQVGFVTVGLVDLTGIAAGQELTLDLALEVILEGMRASGENPTGGVGDVNGTSFAVVSSESNGVANYSVMQLIDSGLLAANLEADPADIARLIDSEQDAMFTLTSLQ